MTSRPVVIVFSVLAGLQVLTGGAMLAEVFGPKVAGALVLAVAAVQAGMTYYVQAKVTPNAAVAAWKDRELGYVVAGPATPTNIKVGEPVEVLEAAPPKWA